MKEMMNWLSEEESGQGMVEYGLIIALIAVAVMVVLGTMGGKIKAIFEAAASSLNVPAT